MVGEVLFHRLDILEMLTSPLDQDVLRKSLHEGLHLLL